MSYRVEIAAGETRVLALGWPIGSVQNEGPATVIVDGSPIPPGRHGTPLGPSPRDMVVTALPDQGAWISVNVVTS